MCALCVHQALYHFVAQFLTAFPRLEVYFPLAAVDVNDRAPHGAPRHHAANAGDREERKQQDYDDLVDTALQKAGSRKALVPSKSKKKMQEVDLRHLTRSKRQLVIEQALQVCCRTIAACTAGHSSTFHKLYDNKLCKLIYQSALLNPDATMQSKDADPERFFGKLKERMQRCAGYNT